MTSNMFIVRDFLGSQFGGESKSARVTKKKCRGDVAENRFRCLEDTTVFEDLGKPGSDGSLSVVVDRRLRPFSINSKFSTISSCRRQNQEHGLRHVADSESKYPKKNIHNPINWPKHSLIIRNHDLLPLVLPH
jgi:hypothetical protein